MNVVELEITQPDREAEGIVEIARKRPITCLQGDRYLDAESGLSVLDRLSIPYTVLPREPLDYARHAAFFFGSSAEFVGQS
jgi:hypothetical protein